MDRLSSLPPELLSTIWDLACDPEERLKKPLSKTLLPYFRQNLYREIRISSSSSLSKLLEAVKSHPSLGLLVFSLDTSEIPENTGGHRRLKKVLRHLPSLRSLSIHQVLSFSPIYDNLPQLASNLQSISFICMNLRSQDADILSRITGLKSVAISFLAFENKSESLQTDFTSTPCANVRILSMTCLDDKVLYHPLRWTKKLGHLVDRYFQHITHLCIADNCYSDYRSLLGNLDTVETSIESLALRSDTLGEFCSISSQHLLPRFKNLKHLELGEGTVSFPLAVYLRQIPHLQSLELAAGTHLDDLTLEDLLSVIDGPSRAESLRLLVVDSINGKMEIGRRIDSSDAAVELVSHTLEEDGWLVPSTGNWDLEDLSILLESGIRN
ncbi:hypothetical protein JCM3765_001841 [Sporobolomyces pararoseus]